jgi:hypothetical protein
MLSSSELAYLVDVDPKWIHNAALRLKRPIRHSVKEAIRLTLARQLHEGIGITLPHAMELANEAIHANIDQPFVVMSPDGTAWLSIDTGRFLLRFNARLAWMRTHTPLPERGRKPMQRHEDAIAAARAYGIDISLLEANLRRTRGERLTELNDNMEFLHHVRRRTA